MLTRISVLGTVCTLSEDAPEWLCDDPVLTNQLNTIVRKPGLIPGGEAVHLSRDIAEGMILTLPEGSAAILEIDDEPDDPSAYPPGVAL